MNVHDSQRMRELLLQDGLVEVDRPEQADVIVVNTCSVREKAEQKLDSQLGKWRRLSSRDGSAPVLVVTGCVASRRGKRLIDRMPHVHAVLGPDSLSRLPSVLHEAREAGEEKIVDVTFDLDNPKFLPYLGLAPATPVAYVAISKGCDQRCSFCIVPQTRGPERHRPAAEIIEEVRALVRRGVREVVLLGQTVNRYEDPSGYFGKRPDGLRSDFGLLLFEIAKQVPELTRLRYTSPHPLYYDAAVVEAHRDLDMLCRHVHMPVQSGSDSVLKRMIRRYDRRTFLEAVDALRGVQPDLTISTDIIVGFPGESNEDFEQTVSIMERVGFFGVYAFKYSPRPGTAALVWGDPVPEEIKSERIARVFEVSERLQQQHLAQLVGTVQTILVEGRGPRNDGAWMGHTIRNEIVHVDQRWGLNESSGLVDVRITRAYRHSLQGEPVDAADSRSTGHFIATTPRQSEA